MALATIDDLVKAELKDLYSAETQLIKALPKMVNGATAENLKAAFSAHLEETREHVARLEEIFAIIGGSPKGKKCKGMEGLLAEGAEMLEEEGEESVIDAGLISAARRVEHYEIAAYSSTIALAQLASHDGIVELLQQTLDDELRTDDLLATMADDEINSAAASMSESE
jgi:ferritin-like metal-binding protein YciE